MCGHVELLANPTSYHLCFYSTAVSRHLLALKNTFTVYPLPLPLLLSFFSLHIVSSAVFTNSSREQPGALWPIRCHFSSNTCIKTTEVSQAIRGVIPSLTTARPRSATPPVFPFVSLSFLKGSNYLDRSSFSFIQPKQTAHLPAAHQSYVVFFLLPFFITSFDHLLPSPYPVLLLDSFTVT